MILTVKENNNFICFTLFKFVL